MNLFCEVINWFYDTVMQGLKDLNINVLQNVITGILTIYIPWVLVFLTDVLNQKNKKTIFEKQCLINEVFKAKEVFLISLFALTIFGVYNEKTLLPLKLFLLIVFFIILYFFKERFKVILNYTTNDLPFKLDYLNRLKDSIQPKKDVQENNDYQFKFFETIKKFISNNFEKTLKFIWDFTCFKTKQVSINSIQDNEIKAVWQSIWSSELKKEEEIEFIKIFFKMFDECFTHNNQNKLLAQLRNIYNHNGQYRIYYTDQISTFLLPKIFEWRCQNKLNILSSYPSFINIENLINKLSKETDYFYEMQQIFLFFDEKFKENIKFKEKSAQLEAYILKEMFRPYLKIFFETITIDNVDAVMNLMPFDFNKNKILNHYFLEEFLIFIKNKRCLNNENTNDKTNYYLVREIISIIFKFSDEKLITSFLKLYFINNYFQTSSDLLNIGFVLKQLFNLNNIKFYTEKNTPIASFYDRTKTDEEIDKQALKENKKVENYQKKQAAKYIFNYFGYYIFTNFDGIFYTNNDNFNLQKKGIYCIDKFKSDLEQFNFKLESYELEYVSDSIKYKDIITDLKELITVLLENLQDPSIFDLEIDD
jgi:hypothetical protein